MQISTALYHVYFDNILMRFYILNFLFCKLACSLAYNHNLLFSINTNNIKDLNGPVFLYARKIEIDISITDINFYFSGI